MHSFHKNCYNSCSFLALEILPTYMTCIYSFFSTDTTSSGVSNPPGPPILTEVPRYNTPDYQTAVRVSWTPPLYTGGVADPWFNVRRIENRYTKSVSRTQGNSLVIGLTLYSFHSVSVGVVSDDGTELGEWGVATPLDLYTSYTSLCGGEVFIID